MLPASFAGTHEGDAVLSAKLSPYSLGDVTVRGHLEIEEGVEIRFADGASKLVAESITIGKGATVLCDPFRYGDILSTRRLTVNGTASAVVTFRTASGGGANGCWVRVSDDLQVHHAEFFGVPLGSTAPGLIEDTLVHTLDDARVYVSWVAPSAGAGTIRHSAFKRGELRGSGLTVQNTLFEVVGGIGGINMCSDCVQNRACSGTRSLPGMRVFDNHFRRTGKEDPTYIGVERDYGPTDASRNYFEEKTLDASYFDAWDGTSSGCTSVDNLGAYGGPLTLTPRLTAPPLTGPR